MGTKIEWTNAPGYQGETWNPVTGCTKISAGCDNCYAERFAERFRGVCGHPYENGFDLTLRPERVTQPMRWQKPRMIFVNSMSDLFHKGIPRGFIDCVFDTMEQTPRHIFQVLTKRSSLMHLYVNARYPNVRVPAHIWLGVSMENASQRSRLYHLRQANSAVRFLSLEPLLGPFGDIELDGIHWVIVGGESGPGARPCSLTWICDIRDQCEAAGVPLFIKQLGARPFEQLVGDGSVTSRDLRVRDRKGGDPEEWPADLRVRQWPSALGATA